MKYRVYTHSQFKNSYYIIEDSAEKTVVDILNSIHDEHVAPLWLKCRTRRGKVAFVKIDSIESIVAED